MACLTGSATARTFFISHRSICPMRSRRSRVGISACIPDPTFDLNSPFVKRLSNAIASTPEEALKQSRWDDRPPLLHLLNSQQLSNPQHDEHDEYDDAQDEKAERRRKIEEYKQNSHFYFECSEPKEKPPDMPSIFLNEFIVLVDYPLVSLIAELIIAQLLYLNNRDPEHPIYMYINSPGALREDGQKVGYEDEGFGVYDFMNIVFNEIRTVVLGEASGVAALLAAAGKKGWRYMFPSAIVKLEEPVMFPTGQLPEVEVAIKARSAIWERERLLELLGKHSGQPRETLLNLMREKRIMWPQEAIGYGLMDKVLLGVGQVPGKRKLPRKMRGEAKKRYLEQSPFRVNDENLD